MSPAERRTRLHGARLLSAEDHGGPVFVELKHSRGREVFEYEAGELVDYVYYWVPFVEEERYGEALRCHGDS